MKLYKSKTEKQTIKNENNKDIEIEIPIINLALYELIDGVPYYFGQEIPKGCEELDLKSLNRSQKKKFLEVFKDRGLFKKNKDFTKTIAKFLDSYIPQEKLLSWDMQYEEAKAFKSSKKTLDFKALNEAYPLIANLCLARYGNLDNIGALVDKILEKSYIYRIVSGNLIGQKQRLTDKIEQALSLEELLEALKSEIDLTHLNALIRGSKQ